MRSHGEAGGQKTSSEAGAATLHVVVPGPLEQWTGGYIYDARMVAGLRVQGWSVHVHNLPGQFPDVDGIAREAMTGTLAAIPDGARVIIDGLAMGGDPVSIGREGGRLRILSLVHHPLADETGIGEVARARFERCESAALAACVGVVVTSDFTARRMAGFGVPVTRVRVAPPGADRVSLAVGPGSGVPPALLCVASVVPRKGQDVLVRALAAIQNLRWTCSCVGSYDRDPAFAQSVVELIRAFGLESRIQLMGECEPEQLDAFYHSATVFVLPSHYEGYGMVLVDALVRGLPIVSTTGGAIPFTVPSGAGVLVSPGDERALAGGLRSLLEPGAGEARRKDLAEVARHHAVAVPEWNEAARVFGEAVLELTP